MTIEADRERLSQEKLLAWLNRDLPVTDMVTVYLSDDTGPHNHYIYCALVPNADVEKCLGAPTWELMHGRGYPGAVQYSTGSTKTTEYCRFGDKDGIEPLVIDRNFHGMRPDYMEISEEFRLFHRLCHDRKQDKYIKIGDDGEEQLVVIVEPDRVQVRLKEIRQFLAIKEMHLAIQFDCREHSANSLEELGLARRGDDRREGLSCRMLNCGDFGGTGSHRAFSHLLGKRLIRPLPKEKSGFWGFANEEPKKCVDFIIGVDENGGEILHTSHKGQLGDCFGANPGNPHYLTPVHFRKGNRSQLCGQE